MKYFFTIIWVAGIMLMACSTQKQEAENANVSNESSGSGIPAPDMEQIQSNIAQGLMGDSTMFPFVYQGEGTSNIFEAYTMKFRLSYEQPLIPMINSAVPWVKPDAFNEQNGLFITYIRNGRELSLSNPYIQVQYIHRDQKNCGTADSVYMWLGDLFVTNYGGQVIKDKYSVQTVAQKPALCMEFQTPDTERLKGKHMAYAYIEYDKDYLIGLALTTTEKTDFDINLPLFYSLVESFSL